MGTNKLIELAKQVLADAKKASKRPWEYERISHDPDQFSYEFFESDFSFAIYERNYDKPMQAKFDAHYIATAVNYAELLAKAVILQQEFIKKMDVASSHKEACMHIKCVPYCPVSICKEYYTKVNALMGEK